MSKLQKLIREICPSGVKFRKLGEICRILDSKRKPVSKGKRSHGIYPYYGANGIQDYVDDYIFDGTFILLGEDGSVINSNKSPILNWAVGKIWVNNHAHILAEISSIANLRYVFFTLQTKDVSSIVRGTPPKLNQENLRNIEIPVPPLPVQEEIVRILDHFTELTAELQAELQARKEQYEYYRNKLLTFTKTEVDTQSVTWMKMSEIGNIFSGKNNSRSEAGCYPVYGSTGIIAYCEKFVYNIPQILIARVGANSGFVHIAVGSYDVSDNTLIVRIKDGYCFKYIYYYLSNTKLNRLAKGGGQPLVTASDIKKLPIPIPSLSEQQRIVSILDKFEALVNDLSKGLPAEIAAVQEQYEYYRNKLLTFKRKA